ncbi:hypothetical protein ACHQM5_009282 [Ranunculus cassubicifolius]
MKRHIPHDLVVEILSWLQIKHLWPLRLVSKTWFQLITANPEFANLHFDRSKNNTNPSILAWKFQNKLSFYLATDYTLCDKAIALEFPFYYDTEVCGVSKGLICLFHAENNEVCILNPFTNDSITFSSLPIPSRRFPGYSIYNTFGFGFDHSSNKFKLIRFFGEYRNLEYYISQVSVYTLGKDSMWRTIDEDPGVCVRTMPNIVVSRALHWLTFTRDDDSSIYKILAFDLKDEVLRKLTLPNGVGVDNIMELGGLLCMPDSFKLPDIEIWAMEEYGVVTSWAKKFRIDRRLDTHFLHSNLCVLGLAHEGKMIVIEDHKYPILYNLESKSVF